MNDNGDSRPPPTVAWAIWRRVNLMRVRTGFPVAGLRTYLIGFALAVILTIASFWAAQTNLIYHPECRLRSSHSAIAQMGIHLIFFLHITTAPDNTNNVLALAFGVLIVCFVVFGSLWIMAHLNHMIVPMDQMMRIQR